jgi:uncharacterized membrane protein (UPF0182 family)
LDSLFGAGASTDAPEGQQPGDRPSTGSTPTPSASTTPTPSSTPTPTATAAPGQAAAVAAINRALTDLQTAQQKGDFAAIGQAQADLAAAVKQWQAAQPKTTPTPSPTKTK